MAIFGPKPWVNPLGKMSIFQVFDLLVFVRQFTNVHCQKSPYSLERRFFVLEYRKGHFPGIYFLKNKS